MDTRKSKAAKQRSTSSRHDVGTPVFAGMIAASAVGLFVIPMLYVTFQNLREGSGAWLRTSYKLLRSKIARKAQA
jgi:hypothetical protein